MDTDTAEQYQGYLGSKLRNFVPANERQDSRGAVIGRRISTGKYADCDKCGRRTALSPNGALRHHRCERKTQMSAPVRRSAPTVRQRTFLVESALILLRMAFTGHLWPMSSVPRETEGKPRDTGKPGAATVAPVPPSPPPDTDPGVVMRQWFPWFPVVPGTIRNWFGRKDKKYGH